MVMPMPEPTPCLRCRLWDFLISEVGEVDGVDLLRALAEMIAGLLARMSEDAASARFLELQIAVLTMERTKRQQLGTAGQDVGATVPGVCGHG